jgi:hypothetical protein
LTCFGENYRQEVFQANGKSTKKPDERVALLDERLEKPGQRKIHQHGPALHW